MLEGTQVGFAYEQYAYEQYHRLILLCLWS